MTNIY